MMAMPGGHLELYEELNECASRELIEETGLNIDKNLIEQFSVINCVRKDLNYHYITYFMLT
jgi:8-oxo-dGTP diphosphatase